MPGADGAWIATRSLRCENFAAEKRRCRPVGYLCTTFGKTQIPPEWTPAVLSIVSHRTWPMLEEKTSNTATWPILDLLDDFLGVPHSTKASFWLSPRSAWSLPHCFRNQHLAKKAGSGEPVASIENRNWRSRIMSVIHVECNEKVARIWRLIKTGRDLQDFAGLRRISALWDVCRVAGPRGGQEAAKVWCLPDQWGHGKSWQDQCLKCVGC